MPDDLIGRIPEWLKSLWNMEDELRSAARNGVILRKDKALAHLSEARRHLEGAMKSLSPASDSRSNESQDKP